MECYIIIRTIIKHIDHKKGVEKLGLRGGGGKLQIKYMPANNTVSKMSLVV